MIGSWDNTGVELAIMPTALADGESYADKFTGNMPTYRKTGTPYTATFTNFVSGEGYLLANKSITFDGVNTLFSTNLRPTRSNSSKESWEFWFNCTDVSPAQALVYQYINSNNQFIVYIFEGELYMAFESVNVIDQIVSPLNAITSGVTHHAVVVKDGTALRMYIDGSLVTPSAADTYALGDLALAADVTIGARSDGVNAFFGHMDDIIFYDGVALTDAQVLNNYNLGRGKGLLGTTSGDVMFLSAPVASTASDPFAKTPFSRNAFRSGRFQRGAFR